MRRAPWILLAGLALCGPAAAAVPQAVDFASAHALVVDAATGQVLLAKEPATPAPIASLTKLLTAMVVLDAKQPPTDALRITDADVDRLKHTRSGVPVGAAVPRGTLLELALVASDNRAASALARHHRGGIEGFRKAMARKIRALGLKATAIEEPTGLSPANVASADDMARVLRAAARYPELARMSSQPTVTTTVAGRAWEVRNTNGLIGAPGWDVLLSKTGYTREAGLCLSMLLRVGERTVRLVLMGAQTAAERALDVQNIVNALGGQPLVARAKAPTEGARPAWADVMPVRATDFAEGSSEPATPASPGDAAAPPAALPEPAPAEGVEAAGW